MAAHHRSALERAGETGEIAPRPHHGGFETGLESRSTPASRLAGRARGSPQVPGGPTNISFPNNLPGVKFGRCVRPGNTNRWEWSPARELPRREPHGTTELQTKERIRHVALLHQLLELANIGLRLVFLEADVR